MTVITLGAFQTLALIFAALAGGWRGIAVLLATEFALLVLGGGALLLIDWSDKRHREDQS